MPANRGRPSLVEPRGARSDLLVARPHEFVRVVAPARGIPVRAAASRFLASSASRLCATDGVERPPVGVDRDRLGPAAELLEHEVGRGRGRALTCGLQHPDPAAAGEGHLDLVAAIAGDLLDRAAERLGALDEDLAEVAARSPTRRRDPRGPPRVTSHSVRLARPCTPRSTARLCSALARETRSIAPPGANGSRQRWQAARSSCRHSQSRTPSHAMSSSSRMRSGRRVRRGSRCRRARCRAGAAPGCSRCRRRASGRRSATMRGGRGRRRSARAGRAGAPRRGSARRDVSPMRHRAGQPEQEALGRQRPGQRDRDRLLGRATSRCGHHGRCSWRLLRPAAVSSLPQRRADPEQRRRAFVARDERGRRRCRALAEVDPADRRGRAGT